ncbi:MAG TPA: alpha/beta hydrolase [Lacunisphaera sp.]|nr:alpha/beta hydrolase [Lacunisphaera sp.]
MRSRDYFFDQARHGGFLLFAAVAVVCGASQSEQPNLEAIPAMAGTVTSKDGVKIAFEKSGSGPAVILVGGALSDRKGGQPLAARLAGNFTVYVFDRRGRGESTDAKTYAVEREIEDLAALIHDAGGSASLYGVSSGAALALHAAAKLGPAKVPRLALYEPPYAATDAEQKETFIGQKRRTNELIKTGQPGDAAAYFLGAIGTPPELLKKMQASPDWENMRKIDFTLEYDYAVLGDGTVPEAAAKSVVVPTLVLDGEKTLDFMHVTADRVAALVPGAKRKTLKGQTHQAAPEVTAPVLIEFFQAR